MTTKARRNNVKGAPKKIPKIMASSMASLLVPNIPVESDKKSEFTGKWVLFFKNDNNAFPNDTAKRSKQSSTSNAIIQSKVVYTTGNGWTIYDNRSGSEVDLTTETSFKEYLDNVNAHGDSLLEVYERCAKDLITIGNFAVEVVQIGGRTNIYHIDATTVRLEKMDSKGLINYGYLSSSWTDIGNSPRGNWQDTITPIEIYKKGKRQKNSLIYTRDYAPEFRYYGLPDHYASAFWQDIEYRIGRFNVDRFDNGFMPSGIVDLYGEPPDGMNAKEYVDEIVRKFTGAGNNSKILFQLLDSQDQKSSIQIFDKIKDGDFINLQKLARESIIMSHRYTPALSGLATSGSLGSNQQIMTEFEIVNNTVIKGYKTKLLKVFNNLIHEIGFPNFELEVYTSMPVSYASAIKPNEVLTINEQRNLIGFKGIDDLEGQFVKQDTTENIDVTNN